MNVDIHYSDVIAYLLDRMPELQPLYTEMASRWHGSQPGPHIVFVDLFAVYIDGVIRDSNSQISQANEPILKKAFSIIEDLACSSDFDVQCLVETGILEHFLGEAGGGVIYARFMGANTKKYARILAKRWGNNPSAFN